MISDGDKLHILELIKKMTLLSLKTFMKTYESKNDTMTEIDLQRVFTYPIYPRDSKTYSDKGFMIVDNGGQVCSHWCAF